jgi:hypothetical protein
MYCTSFGLKAFMFNITVKNICYTGATSALFFALKPKVVTHINHSMNQHF